MSRLKRPLVQLLRDARPDEATQGRMWAEVRRRSRPGARHAVRMVPAFAAACACALVAWLALRPAPARPGPLALADGTPVQGQLAAGAARALSLDDGSRIALDARAALEVGANGPDRFEARVRGRAELTVRGGGPRRWTIHAGPASVRIEGGRVVIAASEERTRIEVLEGQVLLEGEGLPLRALRAGERWEHDRAPPPVEAAPAVSPAKPAPPPAAGPAKPAPRPRVTTPPVASPAKPAPPAKAPAWQTLAAENKYREAYEALAPEGVAPPATARVSLEELIGRADVARLSGHPAEAIPILQRLLDEYPGDRRAGLAAFTKGRIHADALGQPRAAAGAFELALRLGLPRSLAEDAHARAVESWLAAGDRDAAWTAAQRYEAQFPNGQHRERIRRWLERR